MIGPDGQELMPVDENVEEAEEPGLADTEGDGSE
jgi:hypothetical protein